MKQEYMTNNGSPSPRLLDDIQLTTSRPGSHVRVSLVQSQYFGWLDFDVVDKVSRFVHEPK